MPAPDAAHPKPPRKLSRLLVRVALFAALFAIPFAVSHFLRGKTAHPIEAAEEDLEELPKAHAKKIADLGSPTEFLAAGDAALSLHRFAVALSYFEEFLGTESANAGLIDYRIGLCHQALGKQGKAIAAFRKALSGNSTPPLQFACHLALARSLFAQNEPAEARRLLTPFLLDDARLAGTPPQFRADAKYLVALSHCRETARDPGKALTDDAPVSSSVIPLDAPLYLEDLAPLPPSKEPEKKPPSDLVVKKGTAKNPAMIVHVERSEASADTLLDAIAAAAGLSVEWTPDAKQAAHARGLRLAVKNERVRDLLETAAEHLDIACLFDGDKVRFALAKKLDAKESRVARQAVRRDALLAALRADSGHLLAPAALLELGNDKFADGDIAEAMNSYLRIQREMPGSPFTLCAHVNIAAVHLRKGDYVQTRAWLFRAVDQSPGHDIAMRARIRIGRLYLEEENNIEAITHLRRARNLGPQSPYLPETILALAVAHLKNGEPEAARNLLSKDRALFQKDAGKSEFAFLDTLAAYAIAKESPTAKRQASELLGALLRDAETTRLGAVGHLLFAQAYVELGFTEPAESWIRKAAKLPTGPLRPAIDFALAELLTKQDRRDDAAPLFKKLVDDKTRYQGRARHQLARIDFHAKRYAECVESCRSLWTDHTFTDADAVLHLWGAALEATGDFGKAAQCYSGKAPD